MVERMLPHSSYLESIGQEMPLPRDVTPTVIGISQYRFNVFEGVVAVPYAAQLTP